MNLRFCGEIKDLLEQILIKDEKENKKNKLIIQYITFCKLMNLKRKEKDTQTKTKINPCQFSFLNPKSSSKRLIYFLRIFFLFF